MKAAVKFIYLKTIFTEKNFFIYLILEFSGLITLPAISVTCCSESITKYRNGWSALNSTELYWCKSPRTRERIMKLINCEIKDKCIRCIKVSQQLESEDKQQGVNKISFMSVSMKEKKDVIASIFQFSGVLKESLLLTSSQVHSIRFLVVPIKQLF